MSGLSRSRAIPPLYPLLYEPIVRRELADDLGRAGDLTTDAVVPAGARGEGLVVARSGGRSLASLVGAVPPVLDTFPAPAGSAPGGVP